MAIFLVATSDTRNSDCTSASFYANKQTPLSSLVIEKIEKMKEFMSGWTKDADLYSSPEPECIQISKILMSPFNKIGMILESMISSRYNNNERIFLTHDDSKHFVPRWPSFVVFDHGKQQVANVLCQFGDPDKKNIILVSSRNFAQSFVSLVDKELKTEPYTCTIMQKEGKKLTALSVGF